LGIMKMFMLGLSMVTHVYNLSYSGGGGCEDHGLRPVLASNP
jgi:hypothetical protein